MRLCSCFGVCLFILHCIPVSAAPIEAPVIIDGQALSATEAMVWWRPLSQSNVEGYKVKYWRDNEDRDVLVHLVEVRGLQNQTRLEGMKANSRYFIEVQGFSSEGYGPSSERLQIHTKKAPPSQPPIITRHELKANTVYIAWEIEEPLADEANINGFKVLYRQQDLSLGTLFTTSKRYIELPLIENGSYVVEISAHTDEGDGPKAQIHAAPIEAPVIIDGQALSATEAMVWWRPLSQSNVEGYKVKYWRDNEDRDGLFQLVEVRGMQNQTKLDGLKANSRYFIEVQGFSSEGYGPSSERLQIHTKKAPPSQPPIITRHELKANTVYIAWETEEPLADEANINGFKVLYRQHGHSSGTLYTTSKRYIELPLIENESYMVEILAHTDEGDGPKAQIQSTDLGI
ncbi:contactin-1-like [Dicentrarchus labrax]|uniref:contactin-1-like n=1 Tax=Dicentrarchus labrax TaxID=13489 RepID=UPI0021F5B0A6|nr:contactin-1-like [Dicentrarchus labrax]